MNFNKIVLFNAVFNTVSKYRANAQKSMQVAGVNGGYRLASFSFRQFWQKLKGTISEITLPAMCFWYRGWLRNGKENREMNGKVNIAADKKTLLETLFAESDVVHDLYGRIRCVNNQSGEGEAEEIDVWIRRACKNAKIWEEVIPESVCESGSMSTATTYAGSFGAACKSSAYPWVIPGSVVYGFELQYDDTDEAAGEWSCDLFYDYQSCSGDWGRIWEELSDCESMRADTAQGAVINAYSMFQSTLDFFECEGEVTIYGNSSLTVFREYEKEDDQNNEDEDNEDDEY